MYPLDFIVNDIREGDEVALVLDEDVANDICSADKGMIYSFNRGAFPQIYISSRYLFKGRSEAFTYLNLCFRPRRFHPEVCGEDACIIYYSP